MNASPTIQPESEVARKMLLWLSFECPLGGNPCDCQLQQVRRMPFEERRRWLSGLSDAECLLHYEQHRQCLSMKELLRSETVHTD